MTVSATATTDFNVDTIITVALQSVGLLNSNHNASPGDLALGRRLLFLGMQALTNDGIVLRARDRATIALTDGVSSVELTGALSDTLSVEPGGILRSDDGLTDRPITLYTIEMYQRLPNKQIAGVPNFYYPEKTTTGSWRILFYPVPVTGYLTFIVPRTRKLRDVSTGDLTLDLDPKFHLAVVKFLGANLARSKGRRDLAKDVMLEYKDELERAESDETVRGTGTFVAADGPWDF